MRLVLCNASDESIYFPGMTLYDARSPCLEPSHSLPTAPKYRLPTPNRNQVEKE